MPKKVLERWLDERRQWLERHGICTHHAPRDGGQGGRRAGKHHAERDEYSRQLARLDVRLQREFHRLFSQRWHEELDNGHGECVLRQPEFARIVADSLKHFDGERYDLTDLVIMPNHVHVLAAFRDAEQMLEQCESWKRYTATEINRRLNRTGRFWQQDGFDHLVRSAEQFEYLRRYIAENPVKAKLKPGEFVHISKTL